MDETVVCSGDLTEARNCVTRNSLVVTVLLVTAFSYYVTLALVTFRAGEPSMARP